jgi:hypothetical protein
MLTMLYEGERPMMTRVLVKVDIDLGLEEVMEEV